ncbi:MAG: glutathione S-transferase family protein [Pseudorhodoplanes sp.]
MTLKFHFHPLSSFCHKVLIALYENGTLFEPVFVDLASPEERATFQKLWPVGKMPVLEDDARGHAVPESSIIIEYLARHYPGRVKLIPENSDRAWQARLQDRFYDLYLHMPMQEIVADRLRPKDQREPAAVERARTRMRGSLDMIERDMQARDWAAGDAFTIADCAAAPALFYAGKVLPFRETHPHAARYFDRLRERPSYARVLKEAEPYLHLFPQE